MCCISFICLDVISGGWEFSLRRFEDGAVPVLMDLLRGYANSAMIVPRQRAWVFIYAADGHRKGSLHKQPVAS